MTPNESIPQGNRRDATRLFLFSFLILFFELALIRLIPANVRITAYFINLVLIAAFLGMGTGLILQARRIHIEYLFPPFLVVLLLACLYFSNVRVGDLLSGNEGFYYSYFDLSPESKKWGMIPVVGLFFILSSLTFVPLGNAMGREFEKFPALQAYCINIAGSILGIVCFALLSWLAAPPLVWFSIGLGLFLALSRNKRDWGIGLILIPAALFAIHKMQKTETEIWSPYYKLSYDTGPPGIPRIVVNVNESLHQFIFDFSYNDENIKKTKEDYLRPYKLAKNFDDILVLGAGTGNDLVMALKHNPKRIDAVEIDRKIYELGKRLNVHKPYDDPRVQVHIDDGRAFLKKTNRKYDLIVMGTLDSQTLLSGMSNIRLDNYMYTLESFQSIRERLKPDGRLILYHMSINPLFGYKIFLALNQAFGKEPRVNYQKPHRLFNFTFVAGGDDPLSPEFPSWFKLPEQSQLGRGAHTFPTDDWPYLHLILPEIPGHYWQAGGIIVAFSLLLVGGALGKQNIGRPDGALFFLGAGFLLLETKSVTEMSLLFGSTWVVNVLVFLSILVLVLCANLLVLKKPALPVRPMFYALLALVAAIFFVPASALLTLPLYAQWILGGAMVALPLFVAGIIFATIFRTRKNTVKSLGFNLTGSILGGLAEYSSMVMGTKSLYTLGLLMYLLALLCYNRESEDL